MSLHNCSNLDSALNGKGSTVLLSGEAGVGKTRLLDEFLKIAKKEESNCFIWMVSKRCRYTLLPLCGSI